MSSLHQLLSEGAAQGGSDIFFCAGEIPRMRRYTQVIPFGEFATTPQEIDAFRETTINSALKKIYDEEGSCDLAFTDDSKRRFRLNFYSTLKGPALAARAIGNGAVLDIEQLGLPPILKKLASENRGLILISGSTGSGKSTTLAALVNYINSNYSRHILTIEDPIEYLHSSNKSLVSQRELGANTRSFSGALRDAMRENPDVIVVGEMRDMATMEAAISAALTGHLVLSTVHTSDTVQAVERIINMFPADRREQLALDLSSALLGIIAQRLLPRLDMRGQVAVCEVMLGTPTTRKLIGESKFAELDDALRAGVNVGMISFTRAVFKLFSKGLITEASALKGAGNPEEFILLRKGMENGVEAFRNHYGSNEGDNAEEEQLIDMASLLYTSVRQGASDLILTVNSPPSVRLNGVVMAMELPPLQPQDVQRLLLGVITPHQRVAFEEQHELDFAMTINLNSKRAHTTQEMQNCRFRINAFHQRGNVGIVARVVNTEIPLPETLGLPQVVTEWTTKKQGLILVTGPTGSGKSTTLASLIDLINRTKAAHIITIEDPIEYVHRNNRSIIEQRELGADTKSFDSALKYALREAPDVILVGEMRDTATMAAALTAAETGHLVFATIHTNSAHQTVDRIVDSFPSNQQNQIRTQLASSLLGVISQRLLRRQDIKGRIAAFEIMAATSPIKTLIREGKTHLLPSSMETGSKDGMITMERSLDNLYAAGIISYEETIAYRNDVKAVQAF